MDDEQVTEAAEEQAEWEQEGEQETEKEAPPLEASLLPSQEKGGVAYCDLFGKSKDAEGNLHKVKICLTQRADNAEMALRGLLEALRVARDEFKLVPYDPDMMAYPKADQAPRGAPPAGLAPAAPVAGGVPQPPAAPAQVVAPAPTSAIAQINAGVQQLLAVRVEVKARPDGKAEVLFYGANRKFPDLRMIGEPGNIASRFGGAWTPAHFGPNVTCVYNVSLKVGWQNSTRLNSQGQPYKDVVSIE